MAELTQLGSLDSEKWVDILGFADFRPVLFVTKCHTENSSQISHLCRLFFWLYSFSRHLRIMTTGEDRKKDRLKNWKLCVLWKCTFRHHGAIKLTQNCVCFTNPCINPFVPTYVNRKYHPMVLERLHLLQCISAHLQNTLPWGHERHSTSSFLVLIFVPASSAKRSTNSSAKRKRFSLQFPTVTPSSTRLWLSIQFI